MRFIQVGVVIVGAVMVTTLGIAASDSLVGDNRALLGVLLGEHETGPCPAGMRFVATAQTFSCVDTYEAVPGKDCPHPTPGTTLETQENLNQVACQPVSVAGAVPWTYVAREQAAALCARAGKRLPTAAEWYTIALATPDTPASCNTNTPSAEPGGTYADCRSAVGAYDTVGGVWEWVSGDVREGAVAGVVLPESGYVAQVDSSGLPVATDQTEQEQFNDDYFWSTPSGTYGMLRGGYYGSGSDAGVYAVQAKTAPTAATVAIGFRCVQ